MKPISSHTEQELFSRVQTGDVDAFDELYHRLFDELYKNAFKRLKDHDACKDILQEIFLDFWLRASKIENTNIEGYLHQAVRFQVLKRAAKEKNTAFYEPFEEMGQLVNGTTDLIGYKELEKLVEAWINTLPPKRREIFLLHYKEQLTTQQIAERLHLSQKTVQNQLGIAFNDLKDHLPVMALLVFGMSLA